MTPKARELEEQAAQEEGETNKTRSKGRHAQKEGREQWSTTRAEARTIANPEEFRIKEDTAGDGCHNTRGTKTWKNPRRSSRQGSHRQPTIGASAQPEQGGSEMSGKRRPGRLEYQGLEEP